ncbi:MAG: DUF5677 domain-containing protein [Nitrososphaera sp.]|nr:DUF5677 domain-containing protein [Nitrososphaera sp.]
MAPLDEKGFLGKELEQWIPKIRNAHKEFFALADEVNEYCQKAMHKFEAHNKDKQEVLVSTLYIRTLNNYQASILLAERGMMPQTRVLVRAMIEALFSLCAIAKSEKYADDFILEDQKNRLRFLNKFRQLHGGLPPDSNKEEVETLEQQLKEEIKAGDIKEKSTEQWSKDAGMHDWYLTAYSVLSASVHSKVKDLERYLVLNDKNEITEFRWGPDDHDVEKLLMTLVQGMLTALNCARSLFKQRQESQIADFQERLNTLVKERLVTSD